MKRKIIFLLMMIVLIFSVQGCFLLDSSIMDTPKPVPMTLDVGSRINGKTIVWVNTGSGSWRFLAIGRASGTMQWTNNASKSVDTKAMSGRMGGGKQNTLSIQSQFNSQAHTASNNAAIYCRSVGGWLPSREEAEKIVPFANKNFWTSNVEGIGRASYYDVSSQMFRSERADERDKIISIPVYYLDEKGNEVNP